jgi:hypothetical protein
MSQFQSVLSIIRAQNEKREKAQEFRSEMTRSKIAQRIEKLQEEVEETNHEAGGLTAHLTSLNLKLCHFEDLFQKITASTGLTNPQAIVNKFHIKDEIKDQLSEEIDDKAQAIEKLVKEEEELKETLRRAKEGFVTESWRDVRTLQEGNRESEFTANVNLGAMSKSTMNVVCAQEGLLSLLGELEATQEIPPGDPIDEASLTDLWSDEQVKMVFEKIAGAMNVLEEVEKERIQRLADEEEQRKKEAQQENTKKAADGNKFSDLTFELQDLKPEA